MTLITTLQLQNIGGNVGKITTFGQAFQKGSVIDPNRIQATVNGRALNLQVDVKATWDDGSVKHAILSLPTPNVASGANLALRLGTPNTGANAGTIDVKAAARSANYNFVVEIIHEGTTYRVNAASLLQSQTGEQWLSGASASELRVSQKLNNGLTLRFDIRAHSDGNIRTDLTVAYDDIQQLAINNDNLIYDVRVRQNGTLVASYDHVGQSRFTEGPNAGQIAPGFGHNQYSNWRQVFQTQPANTTHIVHDIDYLAAAGAIPAYDSRLNPDDLQPQTQAVQPPRSGIEGVLTGPMGSVEILRSMPNTGGRNDYGPLPEWTSVYLLNQSPDAKALMLETANAAGSVPWHLTDPDTGVAVAVVDYPNAWADPRDRSGSGWSDAFSPRDSDNSSEPLNTNWATDTAHPPELSYIPYLVTGDRYHLEELHAQIAYVTLSTWQAERAPGGLPVNSQVRAIAWSMREVVYGAYITPDNYQAITFTDNAGTADYQQYLQQVLDDGLQWLVDNYVRGTPTPTASGSLRPDVVPDEDQAYAGYIKGFYSDSNLEITWNSWIAHITSQAAISGNAVAQELAQWQVNLVAGGYLQDDIDPLLLLTRLRINEPGGVGSSWADLAAANSSVNARDLGALTPNGVEYPLNKWVGVSSLFSATRDPRTAEALLWMADVTRQKLSSFSTNGDTRSAIAPMFQDRTLLPFGNHRFGTASANNLVGTAANELFNAGAGNDTVDAGNGNNLIEGGDGNDVLTGGTGEDWIFGGSGQDRLTAGGGINYLQGDRHDVDFGRFADKFIFRNTLGETTIGDFENRDQIVLDNVSNIRTAQDAINRLTSNADNNAVLNLGSAGSITFTNRTVSQMSNAVFFDVIGGATGPFTESDDTYIGTNASETLFALGGNDTVYGQGGNDEIHGQNGLDDLFGRAGNDSLYGGNNNDRLYGDAGNDRLFGQAGDDRLYGGLGGADRLDGGTGRDQANFAFSGAGVTASLAQGTASTGDTLINIEDLHGSQFSDILMGNGGNNTLIGNDGNDVLRGFGGNDTIDGGAGSDNIFGVAGADTLIGGSGNDFLNYSDSTERVTVTLSASFVGRGGTAEGDRNTGFENIVGSNYADALTGDNGNNVLRGGRGNDTLNSGAGNDTVFGGAGADRMTGGTGIDFLNYIESAAAVTVTLGSGTGRGGDATGDTNSGFERIIGSNYNDRLTGDNIGNILQGRAGNDRLLGGGGNDILIGGGGNDILTGGTGRDAFRFFSPAEGVDTINDFNGDLIQIKSRNFGGLGSGLLSNSEFVLGATATTRNHRFVYDSGRLFFDSDGIGSNRQILIANLSNNGVAASVGASNLQII